MCFYVACHVSKFTLFASFSSDSRVFIGPDGMEYKWKVVLGGSNPAFPDTTFRTLYAKDSKHPVATTERLLSRDGDSGVSNSASSPLHIG